MDKANSLTDQVFQFIEGRSADDGSSDDCVAKTKIGQCVDPYARQEREFQRTLFGQGPRQAYLRHAYVPLFGKLFDPGVFERPVSGPDEEKFTANWRENLRRCR